MLSLSFVLITTFFTINQDQETDWPERMAALEIFVGDYDVSGRRMTENGWLDEPAAQSSIQLDLNGAAFTEKNLIGLEGEPTQLLIQGGWDSFRGVYRLSVIDSKFGLPDIYEGLLDEGGRLVVTNLKSGTSWVAGDEEYHFRLIWAHKADDLDFTVDISADAGVSWAPFYDYDYVRKSAEN